FEQSAGFLRVPESKQPLDRTAIHPECYGLVEEMAGLVQSTVAELMESPEKLKALDLEKLCNDRFGLPTLQDIRRELSHRGRDRRKAFVPPAFRTDVKELSDLQKGMLVEGTVSNVTSFGAFVDIGVQQEGLVHISELSSRFVQDANQAVHVGQVVKVKVIGVDTATNRISLSIKALRIRDDSRKRKKKKPLKTDSRASTPKPRHASADGKGNHREKRRSGKPERKPVGRKGRQGKKRQSTVVKTAAIQPNRPKTPEVEVLPDTSNLSFSEKIRLLQEKFSGIR
ncbi:MAG: S1 RNA-binding domain-containing protein, partial [Acidobacteriota bacterium]|nr:S1 RNA-binding domain-containing protein [Acidobacteriota bacterium]